MGAIFISYRRDDAQGEALHLCDDLKAQFGSDRVFLDVTGIEPGKDFRKAIESAVTTCDALIVMIGRKWVDAVDESGRRRLEDPRDFVRIETAAALQRDIPVIPVLVQGAEMPRQEKLPPDLEALVWRHAFELRHARWSADVTDLVSGLRKAIPALAHDGSRGPTGRPWWKTTAGAGTLAAAILILLSAAALWQAGVIGGNPTSDRTPPNDKTLPTGSRPGAEQRAGNPQNASPQTPTSAGKGPAVERTAQDTKSVRRLGRFSLAGTWSGGTASPCTVVIRKDDGNRLDGDCDVEGFRHRITGEYLAASNLRMKITRTDPKKCVTSVTGTIQVIDRDHIRTSQGGWNGCGEMTAGVTTDLTRK